MKMKKKDNWYLPDSETLDPLGPFNYEHIVELIKTGSIGVDDFIWNAEFPTERWVRIMEVPDFEETFAAYPRCKFPKKMSKGQSNVKKISINYSDEHNNLARENEYRRYPRAPYRAKAIIHNQRIYIKGEVVDLSEKGLYLNVVSLDKFKPGEEVTITVLATDHMQTFSVRSVIINSKILKNSQGYGIYFLHINPQIRKSLAEYVVKKLNGEINEQSDIKAEAV
jgi:hypothetical protein